MHVKLRLPKCWALATAWFFMPRILRISGGNADVLGFFKHLGGAAYVTAECTGSSRTLPRGLRCDDLPAFAAGPGPNVISRLVRYTQQAYIASGETMDIDDATPKDSAI